MDSFGSNASRNITSTTVNAPCNANDGHATHNKRSAHALQVRRVHETKGKGNVRSQ